MDFQTLSNEQVLQSLVAETAKAINEVRHAQDDLDKADSRLRFILAAIHNLKNRDLKD
jgi:hypothetical protein